jgi:hypothetical protein
MKDTWTDITYPRRQETGGDFGDPVFVSSAEIREVSGGTVPPPLEDES